MDHHRQPFGVSPLDHRNVPWATGARFSELAGGACRQQTSPVRCPLSALGDKVGLSLSECEQLAARVSGRVPKGGEKRPTPKSVSIPTIGFSETSRWADGINAEAAKRAVGPWSIDAFASWINAKQKARLRAVPSSPSASSEAEYCRNSEQTRARAALAF